MQAHSRCLIAAMVIAFAAFAQAISNGPEIPVAPAGSILSWMVSSPTAEADSAYAPPGGASLHCTPLEGDESGGRNDYMSRALGLTLTAE